MDKKLVFVSGEGVGNCVQTIPVIRTLKEVLGYTIDYYHAFGGYNIPKIFPYVDQWFVGNQIQQINPKDYIGIVSTFWTRNHLNVGPLLYMKLLNKIVPLRMDRSEIDVYMQIARDLGAKEEDLIWHGNCDYSIDENSRFDVVIANGYNRHGSANWSIKEYPYYEVVVAILKERGYSVGCIGATDEYVNGTVNRTGLPLKQSFGIIKQSKLLISNDSGMYHAANALETKNIVIFTATSVEKNFEGRFHKFSTIIVRDDLKCRPCQGGHGWKKCSDWKCREINPEYIVERAVEKLI